jgi:HSP20 family protein
MIVPKKKDQLDRLQGEIQELIDELWQVPRFSGLRRGFRPQVDVVRTDDPPRFCVVVELAGVDPEQVNVYADAQTLVIAGERSRSRRGRYFHMEIEYGAFQRRIELGEDVDPTRATATYERGLLRVVLPLAEHGSAQTKIVIEVRG